MPDTKHRLQSMLFNYETTYKTDFRGGDINNLIFTKYKAETTCMRVRPPPLKDVHTLSNWKDAVIPFSLLHKPKEITRTNPTHIQERREKYKDMGLAEAIRTRPRLVMTPAVSMDDIEDRSVRGLLLDNMYTSGTTKAQREVEKPYFSVRAPLPNLPAPAQPVTLHKLQPPLVSREWRMQSVSWDQKQIRTHCDQTKEFWLRRDPPLMAERQRLNKMIKDNETTSRTDYLAVKLRPIVKTEWKPKGICQRIRPRPLKDTHSMTDWKVPSAPYNLYWKQENDVDATNPHVPQKPYQRPVDYEKEHIQQTRPRLVMTPAISLDAIKEPARQVLLDDVYISTSEFMLRQPINTADAKNQKLRIKAPFPEKYAPPKPIVIRKLNAPYVCPEWRMESISWDANADRSFVAPTREFWLRRGLENAKIGRRLKPSTS